MADDFEVTPGTGGTVATTDWAGAEYQHVIAYGRPANRLAGTAVLTGTADFSVLAAPGAGTCNWVDHISYINAGTIATAINIKNGSTILHQGYVPATAGAGYSGNPVYRQTANTALTVCNVTTGGSIYFNVAGFKGP